MCICIGIREYAHNNIICVCNPNGPGAENLNKYACGRGLSIIFEPPSPRYYSLQHTAASVTRKTNIHIFCI